jgi:hypothetical protein
MLFLQLYPEPDPAAQINADPYTKTPHFQMLPRQLIVFCGDFFTFAGTMMTSISTTLTTTYRTRTSEFCMCSTVRVSLY